MPTIKIINPGYQFDDSKYKLASNFNCQNRTVDQNGQTVDSSYNGRKYRIINKLERDLSNLERLARGFLGVAVVIFTLGIALFSKSVRNLFTKSKQTIRLARLESEAAQKAVQFDNKAAKAIENSINAFKTKALSLISSPVQTPPAPLDFLLTEEQLNLILEVDNKKYYKTRLPEGVSIVRGGVNNVFFLDSIPGFVFKPMEDEAKADHYIYAVAEATKIVNNNNLYLLHVPQAQKLEISGNYFIMQEKADLICGNYRQVKGVYSYCYDDIEMQDYIEAVFSQMLEFITKTGFSDVKYDNIPLTHDGHVALIDLDRSSLIGGLTKGGAKGNNGLFNYIPAKYIDYFQSLTKDTLNLEDEALLNNCIEVIKKRNLEKISKKAAYEQFCQNNRISFACQTINQDFKKICADKKKQDFAKIIIAELNKSLANSKNFSPRVGRTVTLDLNVNNSLFKTAAKIWKQIIYRTNKPSNEVVFLNLVPEILDDLKKSGYIHSYKICGRYSKVKIVC